MHIQTTVPGSALLRANVFIYPTETCYGLGCDATNENLVNRVYAIKGRSFVKPVSWIVADVKMAERYVIFSKKSRELAKRFWPGPLTLVLPLREECKPLAALVRSEWVGLRVSSHPIAREISRRIMGPIVATSANVSGGGECYTIDEARNVFKNRQEQPDFYIDGGVLPRTAPTTVVKVVEDNVEIVREGEIKL